MLGERSAFAGLSFCSVIRGNRRACETETTSISPRVGDACNEKRLRVLTLVVASFHGFLSARFVLHFNPFSCSLLVNTTTDTHSSLLNY